MYCGLSHRMQRLFYIARQLSTSNFSSILPMQPLAGNPGCQRFFLVGGDRIGRRSCQDKSLLAAGEQEDLWHPGYSRDKSSPSKMYSHGTSRPKSPPLLTGYPFKTTFPQLVCLFKTLVNQVAFNLAIY